MTIMDFLLISLEFLGVAFGILFIVLVFISICELVDLISLNYLSKKNNNEKSDKSK